MGLSGVSTLVFMPFAAVFDASNGETELFPGVSKLVRGASDRSLSQRALTAACFLLQTIVAANHAKQSYSIGNAQSALSRSACLSLTEHSAPSLGNC